MFWACLFCIFIGGMFGSLVGYIVGNSFADQRACEMRVALRNLASIVRQYGLTQKDDIRFGDMEEAVKRAEEALE